MNDDIDNILDGATSNMIYDDILSSDSDIATNIDSDIDNIGIDNGTIDIDINVVSPTTTNNNSNNNLLLDRFYREVPSLTNNIAINSAPTLYEELNQLLNKQIDNMFEDFHNYQIPTTISNIEVEHKTYDISISRSIYNLKLDITNARKLLKNGYISVLESEKTLLNEIKDLDKMRSLNDELLVFYEILEDDELKDKFKDLALEAYNSKINNKKFKDMLYIYHLMLDLHKKNIEALKDINLFNSKPLCPLCFQNMINYVIIPCGHTFCKNCLDRCANCGVCRGTITTIQQIYII